MLFGYSLMHTFKEFVILFMQDYAPTTSCQKYDVFIAFLPFWVSRYNIVSQLEHVKFFS